MKLISVNVGLPRDIIWRGKAVKSSIWKNPVEGRVRVSTLNLDGDQQSDLSVHGGVDKAIYVYPEKEKRERKNGERREPRERYRRRWGRGGERVWGGGGGEEEGGFSLNMLPKRN